MPYGHVFKEANWQANDIPNIQKTSLGHFLGEKGEDKSLTVNSGTNIGPCKEGVEVSAKDISYHTRVYV